MKFIDMDIKTSKVYLNIMSVDLVKRLTMDTDKALEQFGAFDVISVKEPHYFKVNKQADYLPTQNDNSRLILRKSGVTNIILKKHFSEE